MALFKILATVLVGLCSSVLADVGSFQNLNVLQTVDLTAPYLKQAFDMHVVNVGSSAESSYIFLVPANRAEKLAKVEARDRGNNELDVFPSRSVEMQGYVAYDIVFDTPVQPEEKIQFGVLLSYSDTSKPFPVAAGQSDSQMLLFEGTRNYVSLYGTSDQETQFKILTPKLEVTESDGSVSKPAVDSTGFLTFGPYEKVSRLETIPLTLRYENPAPLARVQNLDRTVWISHWGSSVSFDESYDVENIGTKLDGSFSRVDFTNARIGFSLNTAAIRSLRIALPPSHREEYYVDLVGNVSTSEVTETTLDIAPRYPIMGGWFYNFTIGWVADLSRYVHETSSSTYIFAVPVIGGPEKTGYGQVTNQIVLPEGATVVDIASDVPYLESDETLTYSYLDLYGRKTVKLIFTNLVSEQANSRIYITYKYSTLMAFRKPLSYAALISVGFATLRLASSLF